MASVLFVCTGNIFRSVAAEYALRANLPPASGIIVSSAGMRHAPGARVRDDVARYLSAKKLNVSAHNRRTLNQEILSQSDWVIAMSTVHKDQLEHRYAYRSTLFMDACGLGEQPLLDVDDLFAPEDRFSEAAQTHIFRTIDQIIESTPLLAERLRNGSAFR